MPPLPWLLCSEDALAPSRPLEVKSLLLGTSGTGWMESGILVSDWTLVIVLEFFFLTELDTVSVFILLFLLLLLLPASLCLGCCWDLELLSMSGDWLQAREDQYLGKQLVRTKFTTMAMTNTTTRVY